LLFSKISSLADAERLLAQHELLQEEIAHARPRYENLKNEGEKQVNDIFCNLLTPFLGGRGLLFRSEEFFPTFYLTNTAYF